MSADEPLEGIARVDIDTWCGRGIQQGEHVTVRPAMERGMWDIAAPGGRRLTCLPWSLVVERVDVRWLPPTSD